MAEIVLSSAVRSNLLSLQNTADLLAKTQERLATGLRVNSALDDPTAFFTAASLQSRAGDLNRLLDSIGLAVQTLDAADKGLQAITDLVETAQATARQAFLSASTTAKLEGTVALTSATTLNSLGLEDTDVISVQVGSAAAVDFTIGTTGSTVGDLVTFINDNVANARAELDPVTSRLRVEATNGENLTVTYTENAGSTVGLEALGLATGTGVTSATASGSVNTSRQSLAAQFDGLRTQIDQLARDAGFNGINLLQSDTLRVIFNEKGTSELAITGVDFDSGGLGINASTNNFQDDAAINAALSELEAAIASLRGQASTFGSNLSVVEARQDFTKKIINTLETGAANLTIADTNEEGANLLALQTRQALSSTALSLAAQADQNVLRLFS